MIKSTIEIYLEFETNDLHSSINMTRLLVVKLNIPCIICDILL